MSGALSTISRFVAILALLATQAQAAANPTQGELNQMLQHAVVLWGEATEVRAVLYSPMTPCKGLEERLGWSDFVTRTITINSNCHWGKDALQVVVLHEYGHLLIGSPAHSMNPKSVMFWKIDVKQQITPEDREWLADKRRLERPTIMLAREDGE